LVLIGIYRVTENSLGGISWLADAHLCNLDFADNIMYISDCQPPCCKSP